MAHPRRQSLLLALSASLLLFLADPVYGQYGEALSAEQLKTSQDANLFASWQSTATLDGFVVRLPGGWELHGASVLLRGYEPVDVRTRRLDDGRYLISPGRALTGNVEVVLEVTTGDLAGDYEWTATPFERSSTTRGGRRMRDAFRVTRAVELTLDDATSDNYVLDFGARDARPVALRGDAVPDLGLAAPHTLAFWMKTTGLSQIVLSTWSGDENQAYPIELVVDGSGRLIYYHGRPGQHFSMASKQPVAEGRWHHVAVTNDPTQGWTRLLVDGFAVDSLYANSPYLIDFRTPLTLGGRTAATRRTALGPYSGLLDELAIWDVARTAREVRQTMRQPVASQRSEGRLVLGFEHRIPSELLARGSGRAARVTSDLSFYQPVRNLRAAERDGGVEVSWTAHDPQAVSFVLERSHDGEHFVEAARLSRADQDAAASYHYLDLQAQGDVLYYRVRQVFRNDTQRVSGAIKLGLGAEYPTTVTLVGNFPNPFSTATTIAYQVHEGDQVAVSVWDLSGQLVEQLVDAYHPPGHYEVRFEADNLPSGTYFVRVRTSHQNVSRKMILTR